MNNIFFNNEVKIKLKNECPTKRTLEFHKKIKGYEATPLTCSKKVSKALGVENVWVKDESNRYGLPAFKIMGSSWAIYRLFEERFNINLDDWNNLEELKSIIKNKGELMFVTATDGNHGRGVARIASWFGLAAHIYMPWDSAEVRIKAIESEGAEVTVIDGDYDEAVEIAAREQNQHNWLIQDTAWKGYEKIPTWIIEGYSTIFWEVEQQLRDMNQPSPDLIITQVGCGSLATSVIQFYRHKDRVNAPKIIGVEPTGVGCAMESVKAGKIVTIPGPYNSVMAGLRCGTISSIAWPYLREGIDAYVTVDDDRVFEAMKILAEDGIVSGETGCGGIAGLLEIQSVDNGKIFRENFGIDSSSNILVISTEGATDPEMYHKIVKTRNSE